MTASKNKNKLSFLNRLNEVDFRCKGHKRRLTFKPTWVQTQVFWIENKLTFIRYYHMIQVENLSKRKVESNLPYNISNIWMIWDNYLKRRKIKW